MAETERQRGKAMSGGENGGHTGKISSFCQDGGCVHVRKVSFSDGTEVHLSNGSDNGCLFDRAEWEAFIAGVKNDEFDWDQL